MSICIFFIFCECLESVIFMLSKWLENVQHSYYWRLWGHWRCSCRKTEAAWWVYQRRCESLWPPGKHSPAEAESLECSISQQGQESPGSYFLKLECHFRTCMCMCVRVICYFCVLLCIVKKPYTAVWFPTAFETKHRFCLYHGSMFSSSTI